MAASLPTLRITDYALQSLVEALGSRAPEQGGALLGIRGADVVTTFLHDVDAPVTAVEYHNTDALGRQILQIETETEARFKGIVHSHPRGMPHPSSQDLYEYGRSLVLNPGMSQYLAVIVTFGTSRPPEAHEVIVDGNARVSCFGARSGRDGVGLVRLRPRQIPIMEAVRRAGLRFTEGEPVLVDIDGTPMICGQVEGAGYDDASLLFSTDFPAVPPLLLDFAGAAQEEPLAWDLRVRPVDRLTRALEAARDYRRFRSAPHRPAAGPAGVDPAPVPPPAPEPDVTAAAEPPLFARTGGILSTRLRERRALVVGAGSVGSYVAEVLARSGVGAFTLVDPDRVEPENLGRSGYLTADVGRPKVDALAGRLRAINPAVRVDRHAAAVDDLDRAALLAEVQGAGLVVAATDDNHAQQRLNHLAYWSGTPAVFIGLYARAAGGEVIVTYPGGPCWQCSTGNARIDRAPGVRRGTDYATGRLEAEPGLLTDIHFVSAAGAKLGLALLHGDGDGGGLRAFLEEPRQRHMATVAFAMVPRYELFHRVLGRVPGQYAFQSIWMSAQPQPECPVCGEPAGRSTPLAAPAPPSTETLLRHLTPDQAAQFGLVTQRPPAEQPTLNPAGAD
ncbi:ThiF family adenylyltransferase [Dactylosporangium sp. NPDC049140]|uniref:ThiF family adenylyltransferase n=1 Tax=Dactylosporangium sp. NPDC049140 TaxID=3155647 RepID=UPI00340B5092